MARRDYYPDYYLKKRQRDAVFNRVWKTVIVILVIALGIGVGYIVYTQIFVHLKQPPDNTEQLAGLKGDLEAKQKLQSAASQVPPDVSGETKEQLAAETDLEKIDYAQSFPQINVSVSGSDVAAGSAGETGQGAATTPAGNEPEADSSPGTGEPPKAQSEQAAEQTKGQQKPETKETKKETDSGSSESAGSSGSVASGPPSYEYKIYAGSYSSQGSADEGKRGLSALGLTGKIIRNGADYNLLVGTLGDYDAAVALREKLVSSGYDNSFVTRKTKR